MNESTTESDRPKNVIYLLADALRPDYLGCYGNDDVLTTEIDNLAADGVLFEDVSSAAPWTAPSIASHSTGMYPHNLGIYSASEGLPDATVSIYDQFKQAGYVTSAFLDSKRLEWGEGIDHHGMSLDIQGVLDFISENADEPFFMFNLYRGTHLPHVLKYSKESYYKHQQEALKRLKSGPEGLKETKTRYRRSIEHFSEWYLRAIIDRLEEEGIRDETAIVLTSDHGESFGQRFDDLDEVDMFSLHGPLLHEEVLRTPLIFDNIGSESGTRVSEMVRSVDILPTILDAVGINYQSSTSKLDGISLYPACNGSPDKTEFPDVAYASTTSYENPDGDIDEIVSKCSVRRGQWKIIWTPSSDRTELYNLHDDPDEETNVADEHADITEEMLTELRMEFDGLQSKYSGDEYDAVMDHLEDLGYR